MKTRCFTCDQVVVVTPALPKVAVPGMCPQCQGSMFEGRSMEWLEERQKERVETLRILKDRGGFSFRSKLLVALVSLGVVAILLMGCWPA